MAFKLSPVQAKKKVVLITVTDVGSISNFKMKFCICDSDTSHLQEIFDVLRDAGIDSLLLPAKLELLPLTWIFAVICFNHCLIIT